MGDCLDVMKTFPDNSIDAIITDPPYAKQYNHLYWEIAKEASRILKHGGSYLAILPTYNIPEVSSKVSEYLKYRWMISMWQGEGQHPRMAMGIEIMWKPVGWWVKGSWPRGKGFVVDGIVIKQPKKENHVWEQSMDWARFCVSKFTKPGNIILDPCIGGGTIAVACKELGRNYIGIELDEVAYNTCIERFGG